ncbi:MAG: hypothetical protein LBL19_06360 [Spirochaetaceae bacterium]|jgi:hypothetical protein|nr:hypothetical protein [Spirochaetaceae bacterium]
MKKGLLFLTGLVGLLSGACSTLSFKDVGVLARDLPRHNSFEYLTWFSLPEEYFTAAYKTLEDPYVYIVLSDTGSPGSKAIGLFTSSPYNHVSLSFDPALETLVSYNGGNGIFRPGLNRERLEHLNQKPGASLAVYRLLITGAQKQLLIDRVAAINREGSSYNILGLLTGTSALPNIMFCSQFVYTVLEDAGAAYFNKKGGTVRPMDFINLDPDERLEFAGKIFFNTHKDQKISGEKKYSLIFDSRSIMAYHLA